MDARAILRELGLRPRKGLGQNFLVDRSVLPKIVAAAEVGPQDTVIEVGPGLGVLTERLAATAGRVIAVELDDALADALKKRFAGQPNVQVVHGDVLNLSPADLIGSGDSRYKVVANLPYYITSAVLRHFLEAEARPALMVVMVQLEVAQRIVARPPDMSLLSVAVQFYGRARIVARVPPGAFYPAPKVDSAILRIDVYDKPAVEVANKEWFFHVVQAGFGQRRKQLVNSLSAGLDIDKGRASAALQSCVLSPTLRAEALSLEDWACLAGKLGQGDR